MDNEIRSIDLIHWFHGCNRYLFLAKVHLKNPGVEPQITGNPINYIEIILSLGKTHAEDEITHILCFQDNVDDSSIMIKDTTFKFDLSKEESLLLKQTFERISLRNWKEIELRDIELSQKILCDILMSTKKRLDRLRYSYNI